MKKILLIIAILILNCNIDRILNAGLGTILGSLGGLAKVGSALSPCFPVNRSEFQLLRHICSLGSRHFLLQAFAAQEGAAPHSSWSRNRSHLSQIPATSNARDPNTKLSKAYENRMNAWKEVLPHPVDYPLILTRPHDLKDYFLLPVLRGESIEKTVERGKGVEKAIVDLTGQMGGDRDEWLSMWEQYRSKFLQICERENVAAGKFICIERLKQEEIGGIRILPISCEDHCPYLLEWISCFGLAATPIEIDRWPVFNESVLPSSKPPALSLEKFTSYLEHFSQNWKTDHPQKNLMVQGTLQLLDGLLSKSEAMDCPTRSSIEQLSLYKIREELEQIARDEGPFFNTVSHVEQIHANLSSLLEIMSPFSYDDFPNIYRSLLTIIPISLKTHLSCGLHASGMTSVAGIFKAVEKTVTRRPRVLYGENTYFECIKAADMAAQSSSITEAKEEDWKEVDLIFAQFNPVWKRSDLEEYKVENIAAILRKTLRSRSSKPLTLALDCTLDLINSNRVGQLLEEFQEAIQEGILNIVCYRSGLKFDLFGMDNYSGAPIYMIHNRDCKWTHFDALLSDPLLQTDRLSLNWFCLAYSQAAPQLDLYRRQIFENTRHLLDKIPSKLYDLQSKYRVIPIEAGADPSFIDLHIYGPFHQLRSAALIGGYFYLHCLENGFPIFYRRSLGFYHLNFGLLFGKDSSTIRLTLGLDPKEVDLLADCFNTIHSLISPQQQPPLLDSF